MQEVLSEPERERERFIILEISEGLAHLNAGKEIILKGIKEVFDKKLYKEYGTLEQWAQFHFGLTSRMVHYYLDTAFVSEKIKLLNPDLDTSKLGIRHLLALKSVDEKYYGDILNSIEGKFTEIKIKNKILELKNTDLKTEIRKKEIDMFLKKIQKFASTLSETELLYFLENLPR